MEDGVIENGKIARPPKLEVREREDDEEDREREKRQKLETTNNGGGGGGGGLLDNLISKLASPRPPKPPPTTSNDDHFSDADNHFQEPSVPDSVDANGGGGGGGVINNIISSMFHKSSESSEGEDLNSNSNGKEVRDKAEEGDMINKLDQDTQNQNGSIHGGSSFIANLVPEGPGADEASMLIHSVVHD
ncbi:Antifungal protein [Bienertia sinuspersici]